MTNEISEYVAREAERIEEMDNPDELDFLDAELSVSIDGDVREVTLILTVGGPYVEVNATKGTIFGTWGGNKHTTHVDADGVLGAIEDRIIADYHVQRGDSPR